MSVATRTSTPVGIPPATLHRVLDEGHGPEAWYGADINAAVADVDAGAAVKRPAPGRHNIAEIALHHAFWAREVRKRLTGAVAEAFPAEGEDWFEVSGKGSLTWTVVQDTLAAETRRLAEAADAVAAGTQASPLGEAERFDQVLGIAAHAAYHAGQIQLVKKLI